MHYNIALLPKKVTVKVRSHQTRMMRINRAIRAKLDAWTFWVYSKFAPFAREIHYTTDANSRHGRGFCFSLVAKCIPVFVKVRRCIYSSGYPHTTRITLFSIVVSLVMTSLLEQAPDWLTRREYPPKFRFFNSKLPQDCLSRLCIDLTCKSFARFASFASSVNAP